MVNWNIKVLLNTQTDEHTLILDVKLEYKGYIEHTLILDVKLEYKGYIEHTNRRTHTHTGC